MTARKVSRMLSSLARGRRLPIRDPQPRLSLEGPRPARLALLVSLLLLPGHPAGLLAGGAGGLPQTANRQATSDRIAGRSGWELRELTLADVGYSDGLSLRGLDGSETLYFPLPDGVTTRNGQLSLDLRFESPVMAPSSVRILVNGVPRLTVQRADVDEGGRVHRRLELEPGDLTPDFLEVSIQYNLVRSEDRCLDQRLGNPVARLGPATALRYEVDRRSARTVAAAWSSLPDSVRLSLPDRRLSSDEFAAAYLVVHRLRHDGRAVELVRLPEVGGVVVTGRSDEIGALRAMQPAIQPQPVMQPGPPKGSGGGEPPGRAGPPEQGSSGSAGRTGGEESGSGSSLSLFSYEGRGGPQPVLALTDPDPVAAALFLAGGRARSARASSLRVTRAEAGSALAGTRSGGAGGEEARAGAGRAPTGAGSGPEGDAGKSASSGAGKTYLSLEQLGVTTRELRVRRRASWTFVVNDADLPAGRIPSRLDLRLVSAPGDGASPAPLLHLYLNGTLLRSVRLEESGRSQEVVADVPRHLQEHRNVFRVVIQRSQTGGDCRLPAESHPVEILGSSAIRTAASPTPPRTFRDLLSRLRGAMEIHLPERALEEPEYYLRLLTAASRVFWPGEQAPRFRFRETAAGIDFDSAAAALASDSAAAGPGVQPRAPFVAVGRDVVKWEEAPVELDRGRVQLRQARSDSLVLDLGELKGWTLFQVVRSGGRPGLLIESSRSPGRQPAVPRRLKNLSRADAVLVDGEGVLAAWNSHERSQLEATYPESPGWWRELLAHRYWLLGLGWILATLLVVYLTRLVRRHGGGDQSSSQAGGVEVERAPATAPWRKPEVEHS